MHPVKHINIIQGEKCAFLLLFSKWPSYYVSNFCWKEHSYMKIICLSSAKFEVGSEDYKSGIVGPSQGFWETGGKGISFRGTGDQRPNFEGNREKRQYWGTGNIRTQIFDFWGTGEQANLFQGNKGTGTPPPPWEGRNSIRSCNIIVVL